MGSQRPALEQRKSKMNEIMFNNSLNVRRKISTGVTAQQGSFLPQDSTGVNSAGRRASEDNLDDNGTLGWLIEFGMVDHQSRKIAQQAKMLKVPQFNQKNQSNSQRRSFDEKNKEVSGQLGLYIRSTIDNQHYVTAVNAGSPAEEAGLRVYDKIIQINKQPTDSMQNHQVLKSMCQCGPEIEVVVESEQA